MIHPANVLRTALPCWAVVLVLLTFSPLPLTIPSGIAFATVGMIGWGLVVVIECARVHSPIAAAAAPGPKPALRTRRLMN